MKPKSSKTSIFVCAKLSCIAVVFSLIFACAGSQTPVEAQKASSCCSKDICVG